MWFIRRLRVFRTILNHYVLLELNSGLTAFLLGAWILSPFSHFRADGATRVMAQIAGEHIWGLAFFLGGLFQLYIGTNGKKGLRWLACAGGFTAWSAMATLFLAAGTGPITPPIIIVLALSQLLCGLFLALKD